MASSIASIVRITARQNTVWRPCAACSTPAPMSAAETRCRRCRATARPARRPTRLAAA